MTNELDLVVRRKIRATPKKLFGLWTTPDALKTWWGPPGIRCSDASVDLRVGGGYRIVNESSDGTIIIFGTFLVVEPPERLAYSWTVAPQAQEQAAREQPVVDDAIRERVDVEFRSVDDGTEVIVVHKRIETQVAREGHERGWIGCLDGLVALAEQ